MNSTQTAKGSASGVSKNSAINLSTSIVDRLRSDILGGVIVPGTKLRAGELRNKFDVSLTPVREALMRLAAEGLVIAEDQRGFRVTPVSRQNLMEVNELRKNLECLALRHSIENGDLDWEANVVAALHRLKSLNSRRSGEDVAINEDWERWHRAFHLALIDRCDMPVLLNFCKTLHDMSDRYRRMFLPVTRRVDRQEEHKNIAAAARNRDPDLAVKLLRAHIEQTERLVVEAFDVASDT
jgi:DNA-binding GntR family transcriptional regulator